jgi:hypothetical protein
MHGETVKLEARGLQSPLSPKYKEVTRAEVKEERSFLTDTF